MPFNALSDTVTVWLDWHESWFRGFRTMSRSAATGGIAALRNQRAIRRIIIIAKEHLLPPVAALRDMVRNPRNHDSCQSSHTVTVSDSALKGN